MNLAAVLQILLLPNPGLNLRNLLWHGFVASLPRPWLALVLVLIVILERDYPCHDATCPRDSSELPTLRGHASFGPILQRGEELLQGQHLQALDTAWISDPSYKRWWDLIQNWTVQHDTRSKRDTRGYPLCICILLTCLLEHTLRQAWCHDNQRLEDCQARPAVFYVTLDGHGQRHQHDVLLHPFVGDNHVVVKNTLVDRLGAPAMALLTDLYCSPCGGPNLRASLAHGLWDSYLQDELRSSATDDSQVREKCWDLVRVLLVLVEEISKTESGLSATDKAFVPSPIQNYRPIFSFTAATCRNLARALEDLGRLSTILHALQYKERFQSAKALPNFDLGSFANLRIVSVEGLGRLADDVYDACGYQSTRLWSRHDLFREHETNKMLASLGSARALLADVQEACSSFRGILEEALDDTTNTNTRQQRQHQRVLAVSEMAVDVYAFAVLTAAMLLNFDLASNSSAEHKLERDTISQSVKRSRMVVSTVSNFLVVNADRAIRAAKEFLRGKGVNAIILHHQQAAMEGES
jgi:Domain of unknown function (DUF4209)